MRAIGRRLNTIEKQLDLGRDIQRTVLIFCHKTESKAAEAEQQAKIDRMIQEAIERNPTNPFIFIFA